MITDIVLIIDELDYNRVNELNELIYKQIDNNCRFYSLSTNFGGTDSPRMSYFGTVLDLEGLIPIKRIICQIDWQFPKKLAIVYYQDDQEEMPQIWRI